MQLTGFCRCRSVNSYTFVFMPHFKELTTTLCICKPVSLVMPFLYNASNFTFPTVRLQSVITVRPDAAAQSSGLLLYEYLSVALDLMISKCRIKANAWNTNATWTVNLDIWLCTECCIGFIIIQNNSMHCLYLFTMKRSHQIELEYFFKRRETTQKWSDAVVSLWDWGFEKNCSTNFFLASELLVFELTYLEI